MIGDRYAVEVTLETWEGADSAAKQVLQAVESSGLLVVVVPFTAHLLSGEEEAFKHGERLVCSFVSGEVEVLASIDSDELSDLIWQRLLNRGSRRQWLCVGRTGLAGLENNR